MGLAHRIIPSFLVKNGHLVKGKRFAGDRVVGHARQAIMIQAARSADEILVLDIAARERGQGPNLEWLDDLTDRLFLPLAYGGGIRSSQDVRAVLAHGADQVVLGTMALEQPELMREISWLTGAQAITASIDHYADIVRVRNGTRAITPTCPALAARMAVEHGAGEILLQSIDRDGMMCGYDLPVIRRVKDAVNVPVIASGGAGTYGHMLEALEAGASAVAAGAMFLFTDQTPRGAAEFLAEHGVEVRI